MFHVHLKSMCVLAPTSIAQSVGHHPTDEKVTSLIPGQGTCLDSPGPGLRAFKRQPIHVSLAHQCFSPSSKILNLKNKNKNKQTNKTKETTRTETESQKWRSHGGLSVRRGRRENVGENGTGNKKRNW